MTAVPPSLPRALPGAPKEARRQVIGLELAVRGFVRKWRSPEGKTAAELQTDLDSLGQVQKALPASLGAEINPAFWSVLEAARVGALAVLKPIQLEKKSAARSMIKLRDGMRADVLAAYRETSTATDLLEATLRRWELCDAPLNRESWVQHLRASLPENARWLGRDIHLVRAAEVMALERAHLEHIAMGSELFLFTELHIAEVLERVWLQRGLPALDTKTQWLLAADGARFALPPFYRGLVPDQPLQRVAFERVPTYAGDPFLAAHGLRTLQALARYGAGPRAPHVSGVVFVHARTEFKSGFDQATRLIWVATNLAERAGHVVDLQLMQGLAEEAEHSTQPVTLSTWVGELHVVARLMGLWERISEVPLAAALLLRAAPDQALQPAARMRSMLMHTKLDPRKAFLSDHNVRNYEQSNKERAKEIDRLSGL